jgi:hypothetical protein
MIDIKKALLNPSAEFKRPDEVVRSTELTRDQKIEVLKRWEYDLRELQVAEEESMTAPHPEAVTLDVVRAALRALGAAGDPEHSAPTKHGGS